MLYSTFHTCELNFSIFLEQYLLPTVFLLYAYIWIVNAANVPGHIIYAYIWIVHTANVPCRYVEVPAQEFCRLRREDACSSSALLLALGLFNYAVFAWVFPRMGDRAATAVAGERAAPASGAEWVPVLLYFYIDNFFFLSPPSTFSFLLVLSGPG
jgi:hypothetical protein